MRDLLDDDLAELYSVRPADDVRLARLREQLFTEKPVRRSTRWIGIAAAAMAVVMITGLVVLLRPAHQDSAATMPTAPATSLTDAATLLEVAQDPAARYKHVRYLVWQTMTVGQPGSQVWSAAKVEFQFDVWLPASPGEMIVIYRRQTGDKQWVVGNQVDSDRMAPADYKGPVLWGTFCTTMPCKETSLALPLKVSPAEKLASASSRLLSPYTTNEEKAATYRELATSPEIRWDNGKVSADGSRTSFTIDPATGQVTGSVEMKPADSPLPDGTISLEVAVTYEWTDQRPS
ncbi:hypothetical protein ABZX92_17350 [Lentzea sp. NPDC006480]|uniref:hypothetical protein n=1 Tax=Lentzea sp. NPDC006480 TaxID=3157176 RepID=UPI0033AB0D9D